MEPSTKKRKLAPKVNSADSNPPQPSQTAQPPQHQHSLDQQQFPVQDSQPSLAERHDFESFARHLQDAAMLIQRQADQLIYSDVSVLMLRWEEDEEVDQDLSALENLLQTSYHYRTQRWLIPTVPNPSVKLTVQAAQFLENAKPNHLLIIYYAGHGFVGADGHLYWACNSRDDAAKLKWDSVRYLFEDAQSDILLLLDTCAIPDPPVSGSHGIKQAIAAYTSGQENPRDSPGRSFTSNLVDALAKLRNGRPFSAQRLFEEVVSQHQRHSSTLQAQNGVAPSNQPTKHQLPILYTLTPGKGQSLILSPFPSRSQSEGADSLPQTGRGQGREDQLIDPVEVCNIRFDEPRILVCTTFVGDASPDMSFFHQWMQNTPSLGAKIAVEGMFLGPPTMLLISMPHSVWNVVQHDKVCCFLGYISSHNMLHLYERLVSPSLTKPSAKAVEDGRILLEAREMATCTPARTRENGVGETPRPSTATREAMVSSGSKFVAHNTPSRATYIPESPGTVLSTVTAKPKEENEGSAEMREAAEQLKALSHMRHRSDEVTHSTERRRTSLPTGLADARHNDVHGHEFEPTDDKTTPSRVKAPRRALFKQNETRCGHCSHAPFRDSSSLRKHIAAAHTRPFPCAFSFAGCNSTFGSKNEWKRHITSQHLCLQFYRCSACPQSAAEGKGNEFNRKDLFTQHLRRMHAPFQIKRPTVKSDSKMQADWEKNVKSMQQSCLINRRYPPQKSACPNPDCQSVFEGPGSWDEWTEHVGRHMEKGEGGKLGVDRYLIEWALDETIIEPLESGGYRLYIGNGLSTTGNGETNPYSEQKETKSRRSSTATSKLLKPASEDARNNNKEGEATTKPSDVPNPASTAAPVSEFVATALAAELELATATDPSTKPRVDPMEIDS